MEYPLTRRRPPPPTPTPPSPRLVRSRSGAENNSTTLNASQRLIDSRSKSTTRSRNVKDVENINPYSAIRTSSSSSSSSGRQKKKPINDQDSNKDGFVRFLQRGSSPRNSAAATTSKRPKSTSGSSSPSAWALSPGRSSLNVVPPESPGTGGDRGKVKRSNGGTGGRMGSVLNYFRQKKVSPTQEEEYHRNRVLHNRLMQWRFANARAEAATPYLNTVAEDNLFHIWLRIFSKRNVMMEKRIQIQQLKHEIKLCQIVNPQMRLLNEWAKLEGKNCEAIARVTRKLVASSVRIPLVNDAKGDVESVYEAMREAARVMDGIEETITKFQEQFVQQAEKILYLLTEFTSTLEHQSERLDEMEKMITLVAKLLVWEKSVNVHLMQIDQESSRGQGSFLRYEFSTTEFSTW